MANGLSERRQYKRIPLKLPVAGECLEKYFDTHFSSETRDVSYEGLCLKADSFNGLKVGQNVKIKTRLYPGDFLLKARGRVRWIHSVPHPDWPITIGVKVIKMRHHNLWLERIEDEITRRHKITQILLTAL